MKQLIKDDIVNHPATSYWLKDALQTIDDRDPIDALRDIRTLQIYVEQKLQRVQSENKPEEGKIYALTGNNGNSIANGKSWTESEVTN